MNLSEGSNRDIGACQSNDGKHQFQSSVAGDHRCCQGAAEGKVSIDVSRVGGDRTHPYPLTSKLFQSTPPAWEATGCSKREINVMMFQSTPPAWEATPATGQPRSITGVSIHASRVGGDAAAASAAPSTYRFNPRLPRGRRHGVAGRQDSAIKFQSTPPAWEATPTAPCAGIAGWVSIHASRVGGDVRRGRWLMRRCSCFNPRLPRGRRPSTRGQAPVTR